MKKTKEELSRRDFLNRAAGAALIGVMGETAACNGAKKQAPEKPTTAEAEQPKKKEQNEVKPAGLRSTVVLVRDKRVVDENRALNPEILVRMFDDAVVSLLDAPTVEDAWQSLVKPGDTVGIKSNVWRFLATPKELEQAIRERVVAAGAPESKIDIDDRGVRENPVFQRATALINIRPMRTHHWSGVGSCIKNYIMFSDSPSSWHDDSCANLAGVWDLPGVKGKTRLNVLVMLTPLFQGKGPHHFQAQYTWRYNGLIVGTDPVAVDATGVRILEAKRREYFGANQPFSVPPKHIRVAEQKYHLGVADPNRIDIVKLGWDGEILI